LLDISGQLDDLARSLRLATPRQDIWLYLPPEAVRMPLTLDSYLLLFEVTALFRQ
jgi:hypothetical protein